MAQRLYMAELFGVLRHKEEERTHATANVMLLCMESSAEQRTHFRLGTDGLQGRAAHKTTIRTKSREEGAGGCMNTRTSYVCD